MLFERNEGPLMGTMIDNDMNSTIYGNNNTVEQEMNVDVNMNTNSPMMGGGSCMSDPGRPIVEPIQERQVHKTIMHEVPHVCPIRTKVVNHHIYKHTYRPEYSCCEENVVSNMQCGSCCQFR